MGRLPLLAVFRDELRLAHNPRQWRWPSDQPAWTSTRRVGELAPPVSWWSGAGPLDDSGPLVQQLGSRVGVWALRPQVRRRLGRVGQHEHPPAVVLDNPNSVGRVELTIAGGFHDRAHDHALGGPRCWHRPAKNVRLRNAGIDLAQRQFRPRY